MWAESVFRFMLNLNDCFGWDILFLLISKQSLTMVKKTNLWNSISEVNIIWLSDMTPLFIFYLVFIKIKKIINSLFLLNVKFPIEIHNWENEQELWWLHTEYII